VHCNMNAKKNNWGQIPINSLKVIPTDYLGTD
jgi:hypothetical protein